MDRHKMEVRKYLDVAVSAAREAGDFALRVQNEDLKIETKSTETDLVTFVDKRNEQTIRETVLKHFPGHSCIGEEYGKDQVECDVNWIIDPIDGTVNYAHRMPVWCVSIGVEVKGVVECGAIYNPNLNEMFTAVRGEGAWLNDKPIRVSNSVDPNRSLFVTGFPYHVHENPDRVIEQFVAFLHRGLLIRRLGSAALDLAYVACGRFDGFWEAGLSPWDTSAGQLLVREAGGKVTHYDGEDYNIYRKSIIASNVLQHEMIQEIIASTLSQLDKSK
jgi:myo-inositol-1(or 4)-monophosphatase